MSNSAESDFVETKKRKKEQESDEASGSGKCPESSRVESGKCPETSRVGSGKCPESSRVGSGKCPESSRVGFGKCPESSRVRSGKGSGSEANEGPAKEPEPAKRDGDDDKKPDDDEEEGVIPLSKILGNGITESDLDKLRSNGFCTVEAIAFASTKQLCKVYGISQKKAEKLIAAAEKLVPTGFSAASVLYERRSDVIHITTGSRNLDQLLLGGIETGSVTEIFGENRAGKTQVCMTLAVTCQLPVDRGGAEGKCLFIDTEGTFRPEKLLPIAQRYNLNSADVLDNVVSATSFNSEHQSKLLIHAAAIMSESRYALLIIDSATALFRCDYSGRGELYDRQTHLCQFLRQVRRICDEYGVAAIYTNQVVSDVNSLSVFAGSSTKAIGGNIMAHASTTRLSLRKAKGDNRVCKVYSSPIIPESEATFTITSSGIDDPKDLN